MRLGAGGGISERPCAGQAALRKAEGGGGTGTVYPECGGVGAVQPEPLTPADIEVNLGAIWVPVEYYRQFMYETFQTSGYEKVIEGGDNRHRIDIEYFSYTTTWRVTNKNAEPDSVMVNQTFGTKRKNAYENF